MRWKDFILGENTIDRCTESRLLDFVGDVAEDMVCGEVGADALADGPTLDVLACGNNLACQIGTGDDVLLLAERVLTLCDDQVAELEFFIFRKSSVYKHNEEAH